MVASLATAFPWRSLDSIRRADVARLAQLRRAITRVIDPRRAEASLREMLGPCELSVQLRRLTTSPPRIDESAVGALVVPADRVDPRRAFAVILDQGLAVALAGRALRRAVPRVVDSAVPGSAPLAGAVGALLVAAARRGGVVPLRVLTAGAAHGVLAELVTTDPSPLGATFTVLLDHDAHLGHVFAPRLALEPEPLPELDGARLGSLGPLPIEVPLVGGVLAMTATELAALSPGDALFPVRTRPLDLSPSASDVAFGVEVADGERLVLRDGPRPLCEEEPVDKDALAQSLGETPIVVRVEVGSAQMTAREWAALGAGDVISLGKRIGEQVTLRVSGVEVARGELVEVEGEVGVRIVSRAGDTVA